MIKFIINLISNRKIMKKNNKGPLVLCILDGWGETNETRGNPISKAKLPVIDKLNNFYPKTFLQASGIAVGLPWGVVGNSEVGHQAMGTGQIIYQKLPIINTAIQDGSFFKNETILNSIEFAKENKSKIHLFGLVSDGGVHSHVEHLFALLEVFKMNNFKEVYIHVVTDGRDTAPQSAQTFLDDLSKSIEHLGVGKIATVSGRYYSMDRSQNWDRLEKAYNAMAYGEGLKAKDSIQAIKNQYKKGVTDEFMIPTVIEEAGGVPVTKIQPKDVFISFNFRRDRAKQVVKAFSLPDFDKFKEIETIKDVKTVCFTEYEAGLPVDIIFASQKITSRVGEEIEKSGLRQLRIAETEKFAHVTYFFDGGKMIDYEKGEKIHILSKKIPSYDKLPEMSAQEVTNKIVSVMDSGECPDFVLVNYANPDMVGHTGKLKAGIKAVEFTDKCLGEIIKKTLTLNGTLIVTADHGNVEEMVNLSTGEEDTEHSNNPVPCWLVTSKNHREKKESEANKNIEIGGFLSDIAPTILELLGIKQPKEMTGGSLISLFKEGNTKKEDQE